MSNFLSDNLPAKDTRLLYKNKKAHVEIQE